MPKIDAPTVAEHRVQVHAQIVDAAERILRSDPERLTAGAVSRQAGIARNSIYRYVDSVDDLRTAVLDRHLPAWQRAVEAALAGVSEPEARIAVWARVNLEQAAATGHGWLMALAHSAPLAASTERAVRGAHTDLRDSVDVEWARLVADHDRAGVGAELTRGLVEAGLRSLDAGRDHEVVITTTESAVCAVVQALADRAR